MLPVLIILCVGFELLTDRFGSWQNLSIVMQQASINVVLAAGMTFVILTSGIDLSVGSTFAIAGAVTAKCLVAGIPVAFSILTGLGIGVVIGLINGFIIADIGINPFVTTLAMMSIVRELRFAGQLSPRNHLVCDHKFPM